MSKLPQILAVPEKATLYGSSRLGSRKERVCMTCTTATLPAELQGVSYVIRGEKSYELSNHLGNVLAIVSDRREAGACTDSLVDFYYADGRSVSDYYPFGMAMDSRTQSAGGYRWGFNGQEKDDEVAWEGNSYTAEFWQYDSRLGRRWNLDPKPQISVCDYAVLANNPILLIDPLGDKVKFTKDKDVSRKEFREMKRNIRDLRRNSEAFSAMYNDLNSRKETYTYNTTTKSEGSSERSSNVINIGINYTGNTESNGKEPYNHAQLGLIAHETGHMFRQLYNLDPPFPSLNISLQDKDYTNWNNYSTDYQRSHEISEKGALHIENIVRSELSRSGKFGTVQIRQYYRPGLQLITEFDAKKGIRISHYIGADYDLFSNGHYNREYYNRKINIYEELGISMPKP